MEKIQLQSIADVSQWLDDNSAILPLRTDFGVFGLYLSHIAQQPVVRLEILETRDAFFALLSKKRTELSAKKKPKNRTDVMMNKDEEIPQNTLLQLLDFFWEREGSIVPTSEISGLALSLGYTGRRARWPAALRDFMKKNKLGTLCNVEERGYIFISEANSGISATTLAQITKDTGYALAQLLNNRPNIVSNTDLHIPDKEIRPNTHNLPTTINDLRRKAGDPAEYVILPHRDNGYRIVSNHEVPLPWLQWIRELKLHSSEAEIFVHLLTHYRRTVFQVELMGLLHTTDFNDGNNVSAYLNRIFLKLHTIGFDIQKVNYPDGSVAGYKLVQMPDGFQETYTQSPIQSIPAAEKLDHSPRIIKSDTWRKRRQQELMNEGKNTLGALVVSLFEARKSWATTHEWCRNHNPPASLSNVLPAHLEQYVQELRKGMPIAFDIVDRIVVGMDCTPVERLEVMSAWLEAKIHPPQSAKQDSEQTEKNPVLPTKNPTVTPSNASESSDVVTALQSVAEYPSALANLDYLHRIATIVSDIIGKPLPQPITAELLLEHLRIALEQLASAPVQEEDQNAIGIPLSIPMESYVQTTNVISEKSECESIIIDCIPPALCSSQDTNKIVEQPKTNNGTIKLSIHQKDIDTKILEVRAKPVLQSILFAHQPKYGAHHNVAHQPQEGYSYISYATNVQPTMSQETFTHDRLPARGYYKNTSLNSTEFMLQKNTVGALDIATSVYRLIMLDCNSSQKLSILLGGHLQKQFAIFCNDIVCTDPSKVKIISHIFYSFYRQIDDYELRMLFRDKCLSILQLLGIICDSLDTRNLDEKNIIHEKEDFDRLVEIRERERIEKESVPQSNDDDDFDPPTTKIILSASKKRPGKSSTSTMRRPAGKSSEKTIKPHISAMPKASQHQSPVTDTADSAYHSQIDESLGTAVPSLTSIATLLNSAKTYETGMTLLGDLLLSNTLDPSANEVAMQIYIDAMQRERV